MNFLTYIYTFATRKNPQTPEQKNNYIKNNYLVFLFGGLITQISDVLSSTKTILVWVMNGLGAPVFLTALLVPIRESGSMLPQVFLVKFFSQRSKRLPLWIMGARIQAASLIIIGIASLFLKGTIIGIIVVILVALFSFGRSLCSLSSKDIIGRTIPKKIRGSLTGYTQAISGAAVLVLGLWFQVANFEITILSYIIITAGILWLLASYIYSYLVEPATEIMSDTSNSLSKLLSTLKSDTTLQRFIIARALLLCSALTTPFYVMLAQQSGIESLGVLGLFIIVTGIAGIVSAPFWGHLADHSSGKVMAYAGFMSSLLVVLVIAAPYIYPLISVSWLFYTLIIFLVTVAHNGVRIGRKTYIINSAEGEKRLHYISISNTLIAIVLLFVGLLSSALATLSLSLALGLLSIMGLVGSYLSYRLPSVNL